MTDAISKERLAELIYEATHDENGEAFNCDLGRALRELQQLHDERKRLLDFFTTYALGPKKRPSCLVCGTVPEQWPPAIEHAELPGIIVCHPCRDARSELQQLREQVRVPREPMKGDNEIMAAMRRAVQRDPVPPESELLMWLINGASEIERLEAKVKYLQVVKP